MKSTSLAKMEDMKKLNKTLRSAVKLQNSVATNSEEWESFASYATAYVLYTAHRKPESGFNNIDSFIKTFIISEDRKAFVNKYVKECWGAVMALYSAFPEESFKKYIIDFDVIAKASSIDGTPSDVASLVAKLLQLKTGDVVTDLGCGCGNFIRDCYREHSDVTFKGTEIDEDMRQIASIRAELLANKDGEIFINNERNILDFFYSEENASQKTNKVFCHCPVGCKGAYMVAPYFTFNQFRENSSLEWIFCEAIVSTLCRQEAWRAVCLVSLGALTSTADIQARNHFIKGRYIESVIALPEKILGSTYANMVLLVLSPGNKEVSFVDGTEFFTERRRYNEITDSNIDTICNLISSKKGEKLTTLTVEELTRADGCLSPSKYLISESEAPDDSFTLGEICTRITRGTHISPAELDKLVTDSMTPFRYISLKDIDEYGLITSASSSAKFLSSFPQKSEKYLLRKNSIVLSKTLDAFKLAIVAQDEPFDYIAGNNTYIIDVDPHKANPYYVMAYLESNSGKKAFKASVSGSGMAIIGLEALRNLRIPAASNLEQESIAKQFIQNLQRIIQLREELDRAKESLLTLLNNE